MAMNELESRLGQLEARVERLERAQQSQSVPGASLLPQRSGGNSGKIVLAIIAITVLWLLARSVIGYEFYYIFPEGGILLYLVAICVAVYLIHRSGRNKISTALVTPGTKAPRGGVAVSTPVAEHPLMTWVKQDWLMKLGALLLLLALVWFVRYAFLHNWIGPVGRIALGLLAGVGILVWGNQVMQKRNAPGQVLIATGTTMFLVTMFAARNMYDFFTPGTALAAMSCMVITTAIIAVVRNAKWLAVVSFIGGAVAPLLTESPEPNYTMLLAFVFALDVGVLIIVSQRGWRDLIVLSLIGTALYSVVFDELTFTTTALFMAAFYLLFFTAGSAASYKTNTVTREDLVLIGLNAVLLLWWVNEWVPEQWQPIAMALAALFSTVAAQQLFSKQEKLRYMVLLHAAAATVFIGAATAFALDGAALTIAWSLEVLAIVVVTWRVLRDTQLVAPIALLHIVPIFSALDAGSYELYQWQGKALLNEHYFTVLCVTLSLAATAWIVAQAARERQSVILLRVLTWATGLSAVSFVWLVSHTIFSTSEVARGIALVIYALVGVGFFYRGIRQSRRIFTITGGIFLGGVVLRLLFVEVWDMPLAARIVTFVVVGALLVSTAFYQKKFTH